MEAVYNVFVRLPTGYEKSLCYQALPFIVAFKLGLVGSQKHSLVLVVSPLVALMVTSLYLTYVIGLDPAHLLRHFVFNYAHANSVYQAFLPAPSY